VGGDQLSAKLVFVEIGGGYNAGLSPVITLI
jgi:hypothetical protein